MGVDLVFVLSGFLITGILLDTRQSHGYFKNFYVRRCLRIWPLYYSLIFFMFVVVRSLSPSEARAVLHQSSPWWAYPLFLQNFLIPVPTNGAGPLGVTWSLAIEEQFYLVWPLFVRFCSRTQLRRIAIAEICISPALRFYLSLHHVYLYTNVFCRLGGLIAGALRSKWLQGLMTNGFLVYTGTISYGLYLLHKIPFGAVQTLHLDRHSSVPCRSFSPRPTY